MYSMHVDIGTAFGEEQCLYYLDTIADVQKL